MKKSDFFFDLPEELIAQTPVTPRDSSRLLVMGRESGELAHRHFYDIVDYLHEGDLLIANNSKVLPARLYGEKAETGAKIETLLLNPLGNDDWEVLCKPGRKMQPGIQAIFGGGRLTMTVKEVIEDGNRIVHFDYEGNFYNLLDEIGEMPLPHYIHEKLKDRDRYQTVYSKDVGSAAAPTAGLHFTPELMQKIRDKGVKIAYVTLHVGLGTFRPVKEDDILKHVMHKEHYYVSEETAKLIEDTKAAGGRVIGVGTTTCRTLEATAQKYGKVIPCSEDTDIFIYPGFEFKVLDGLITNFHLPESTLIMLVSAFAGYDHTMAAYQKAIEERYRFFSFGDAMAIL